MSQTLAANSHPAVFVGKEQHKTAECNNRLPPNLPLQTDAVVSCDFPITSSICGEQDIRSTPVLGHLNDAQNTGGLSFVTIGRSWAQLLRIYAGADEVAFAWTDDSGDRDLADPSSQPIGLMGLCVCTFQSDCEGVADPEMSWRESSMQVVGSSMVRTLLDFTGRVPNLGEHFDMALMVTKDGANDTIRLYFDANRTHESFAASVAANLRDDILRKASALPGTGTNGSLEIAEIDKSWIRKQNDGPLMENRTPMTGLFKQQARASPDSEAVWSWDARYTFSELDQLSDKLAHHLISLGLKRGGLVPVMLTKSALIPVALLAVSKAGGAFIPLNPDTPAGRIADILEDTRAELFICSELEAASVHGLIDNILILTHEVLNAATDAHNQTLPDILPHETFACLFTSGSTGKPKGVILSHQSIATNVTALSTKFDQAGARHIQSSAMAFDLAMSQIFVPLLGGGCVCIPQEDEYKTDLVGAINRMRVDAIITVPSYAALIDPESVPSLKTVFVGGELLKPDVIRRWSNKVRLVNIYGPSEAGPVSTVYECGPSEPRLGCIGSGIPCHRTIVVSPKDHNKLVPVGAVGHLLLGSVCLAEGYLNQPEKTSAEFIKPPLWAKELGLLEQKFYCSGDLVRYDPVTMDGSLMILGRKDTQVKLRGQRIELGEIEYSLQQLPGVQLAMATVAKSGTYADKLVAILGLGQVKFGIGPVRMVKTPHLTISMMKEHLRLRLPGFMVPTVMLTVDDMIFTGTLKVDRKKMSAWLEATEFEHETTPVLGHGILDASETTSAIIADKVIQLCHKRGAAFQSLLEGRNFSLDEAGLDSIQLIATSIFIRSRFGVSLPRQLIFGSDTTVRSLAEYIDASEKLLLGQQRALRVDIQQEVNDLSDLINAKARRMSTLQRQDSAVGEQVETPRVFLTGATGFLGCEILHQLMSKPEVRVVALVRADSAAAARKRVVESAVEAKWWHEDYESRLEVWQGDLSSPELGITPDQKLQLMGTCSASDRISVVIHNGAVVHYGYDYNKMKATNVMSTVALLKIQRRNNELRHRQRFVFVSGGQQLSFDEESDALNIAQVQKMDMGYAQSKLVAELLVKSRAQQKILGMSPDVSVVKPGYIVGTADGRVKPVLADFIWRYVVSCVSLQAISLEHLDNWVFVAEVPKIAGMVISRAFEGDRSGKDNEGSASVTKALGGMRLSSLVELLTDEFKFMLRPMPKADWLGLLRHAVERQGEKHPMFPLMHQFEGDFQIFQPEFGQSEDVLTVDSSVVDVVRANIHALVNMGVLSQ